MVRALRGATRDPALPRVRGRQARPPSRHRARDVRDGRALRRGGRPVAGHDRPGRVRRPLPHTRRREPVVAQAPRLPRPGELPGRVVHDGALARGAGRPRREARRRRRDRLDRHPGRHRERAKGARPFRVPADAELQHAGAQRPARPGVPARGQAVVRGAPADVRAVRGRRAVPGARASGVRGLRRGAPAHVRGGLGPRRHQLAVLRLLRLPQRRGRQRDGRRVHAGADPRDRARARRGGAPLALAPHRDPADVRRHRLLRGLQPGERPPGRRAALADREDHGARDPDGRRRVRARRDRLRDSASTR